MSVLQSLVLCQLAFFEEGLPLTIGVCVCVYACACVHTCMRACMCTLVIVWHGCVFVCKRFSLPLSLLLLSSQCYIIIIAKF